MRFTQDTSSGTHVIRAYSAGEFRIDERAIRGGVIVSATVLLPAPELRSLDDLLAVHVERILALDPEVVLLGTGQVHQFPAPSLGAQFLAAGIGFEVMNSGAACRTFNVLVGESRRAVAALLP